MCSVFSEAMNILLNEWTAKDVSRCVLWRKIQDLVIFGVLECSALTFFFVRTSTVLESDEAEKIDLTKIWREPVEPVS